MKKNKIKDSVNYYAINVRLPQKYLDHLDILAGLYNLRRGPYIRKVVLDHIDKNRYPMEGNSNG